MQWFLGERTTDGVKVFVVDTSSSSQRELTPDRLGFEWGYSGEGPSQLALAMLLEVTGDERIARKHCEDFKFNIVAKLHRLVFALDFYHIWQWIADKEKPATVFDEPPTTGHDSRADSQANINYLRSDDDL